MHGYRQGVFKFFLCAGIAAILLGCIPLKIGVSPDGRISFRGKDRIYVTRPDGSEVKAFLEGRDWEFYWTEWSPDGKTLAISGKRNDSVNFLLLFEPDSGKERLLVEHSDQIWLPGWSPDGKAVSYIVEENDGDGKSLTLKFTELEGGADRIVAKRTTLGYAWSPDGKKISTAVSERPMKDGNFDLGSLALIEAATGKAEYLAGVLHWPYMQFAFSKDGKSLYFSSPMVNFPVLPGEKRKGEGFSLPKVKSALFAYDFEKKSMNPVTSSDQSVVYFALSPDGKRFLYVDVWKEDAPEGDVLGGTLYVSRTDGTERKKLAMNSQISMPVWLNPSNILFLLMTEGEKKKEVATLYSVNIEKGEPERLPDSIQKILR